MFTDMVGYTALGQRNEPLAVSLVGEQRRLIRPILRKHNGREVKSIGDAFLIEFASALDAVNCAVDIQSVLKEANASNPEERKLRVRIGVHLGDIIHQGGDVMGDAVNVASRLEALSPPGGICVSAQVYHSVVNKVQYEFESLGVPALKNVTAQVEVYQLVGFGDRVSKFIPRKAVSAKERIAILPFANMSPDPADEYFADGLTEELIDRLSQVREVEVIARTSIMGYKKKEKKAAEIAKELGVGSLVEGSVRKAGGKIRVTVQLINGATEGHIWSSHYDRDLDDIFAVQSEIAEKVVGELKVRLLESEMRAIGKKPTENTEAYTLYLKGRYHWNERTKDGNDKAVHLFERASYLDPQFALAYAGLSDCYHICGDLGWLKPVEAYPKAREFAMKSIGLDPDLAEPHASLGAVSYHEWRWKEAEGELVRALELKPNYSVAHLWYSVFLVAMGRLEESYAETMRTLELDPLSESAVGNAGFILRWLGRAKEAMEKFEKLVDEDPENARYHDELGWSYYYEGRSENALSELRKAAVLSKDDPSVEASLAIMLALVGESEEATAILKKLEISARTGRVSSTDLAEICFILGRVDEAFGHLERAVEDKSNRVVELRFHPLMGSLRADPRWASLEERMGL